MPLSGPTNSDPSGLAITSGARPVPTPGSTTATWIDPAGKYVATVLSKNDACATSCGGTPWSTSTTRVPGLMPRITPFIAAGKPSREPKSVVSVTTGGTAASSFRGDARLPESGSFYRFSISTGSISSAGSNPKMRP